jgi:hypothetical protein
MFRGPSFTPHYNALRVKRKLSSDYAPLRPVKSKTKNNPLAPATDADRFQFRALEGLKHFSEHGDYTKLTNLMLTLVSKRRETLFANWCKRFARLVWDTKNRKFRWERGSREFDIASAETTRIGIGSRNLLPVVIPTNRTRLSVGDTARCAVCGAIAMQGEDTCYGHMIG